MFKVRTSVGPSQPLKLRNPMPNLITFIKGVEASIDIFDGTIEQFPYRKMLLGPGMFLEMKRGELVAFEHQLAEASGKPTDNHVVYGITMKDSPTLYVRFHDNRVTFGLTIRPHP